MTKIELSPWQDPEDGFPSEDYFDAVINELRRSGIDVDSWRTEAHEFVIELDRDTYAGGDLAWAKEGLNVGWRVNEESDPLGKGDDEDWHGFVGVTGSKPGWFWAAYTRPQALADTIRELEDPATDKPLSVLAEPSVVAAAVAALVRGSSTDTEGK